MEIKDSTKTALIRKGNELFNQKDITGAYRCYITASYFAGIEKVADHYNFEEKNFIKAIQLYKYILKEDSNLGGNIRAKSKLDDLSKKVVKIIRKWIDSDPTSFTENFKSNNTKIPKENNISQFYSKSSVIKKAEFDKYINNSNKNKN